MMHQDVGRLLLLSEPIIFSGSALKLMEADTVPLKSRGSSAAAKGGLFVPRTAVSRPRAGLGHARTSTAASTTGASGSEGASTSATGGQGKGQDDFRKLLSRGK